MQWYGCCDVCQWMVAILDRFEDARMGAWATRGWIMICLDFEGGEERSEAIFCYRSSWDGDGHRER